MSKIDNILDNYWASRYVEGSVGKKQAKKQLLSAVLECVGERKEHIDTSDQSKWGKRYKIWEREQTNGYNYAIEKFEANLKQLFGEGVEE